MQIFLIFFLKFSLCNKFSIFLNVLFLVECDQWVGMVPDVNYALHWRRNPTTGIVGSHLGKLAGQWEAKTEAAFDGACKVGGFL
jgi:hypothetical protein